MHILQHCNMSIWLEVVTMVSQKNKLNILVPVKNREQGRLACAILKNCDRSNVASIKLFHCVKDKVGQKNFFSAMDLISTIDEQTDKVRDSSLYLEQLAGKLEKQFPGARISFASNLNENIATAIVDEAHNISANLILLVTELNRKKHWLLPSIVNRVLQLARCHVSVVKPSSEANSVINSSLVA